MVRQMTWSQIGPIIATALMLVGSVGARGTNDDGPEWVSSRVGEEDYALKFDGANDFVIVLSLIHI